MRHTLLNWWNRAFLIERSSISLSFFRIVIAWTIGAHVIGSLIEFEDNYSQWAFKEHNASFFPIWFLEMVSRSPEWLTYAMAGVFLISWFTFFIGLCCQASAIILGISCYFFYALNSLHIGTLSWDILLVTFSLMYVTNYHGDYFSIDGLIKGDPEAYRKPRPFFVQRLLQLQMAFTFLYTSLCKWTAEGNWTTGNPYYHLMTSNPQSVVKQFPGRAFLAQHPDLCYGIGIGVIIFESLMPLLLLIPPLRWIGIPLGIFFMFLLLVTLHVPTIFFFLFPAQMLLCINPDTIVAWIDRRRAKNQERPAGLLIFDGQCGFCQGSLRRIRHLDLLGVIQPQDLHLVKSPADLHPNLTKEACLARIHYLEKEQMYAGFYAFRQMAKRIVLLWPLVPFLYLPGAGAVGQWVYDRIAHWRFRISEFLAGR